MEQLKEKARSLGAWWLTTKAIARRVLSILGGIAGALLIVADQKQIPDTIEGWRLLLEAMGPITGLGLFLIVISGGATTPTRKG